MNGIFDPFAIFDRFDLRVAAGSPVWTTLQLPRADANGLVDLGSWGTTRDTDSIYVPDYQGNIVEIPAGYPVLEGARIVDLGGGDIAYYMTDDVGDPITPAPVWIHYPASTNYFLNNESAVDQTSPSLATGSYTLSVIGSGSVEVAANTATGTGFGTASEGTDITISIAGAGTVDFTVAGTPTSVQFEPLTFSTPHIQTAGSPVTRQVDNIIHPYSSAVFNQESFMVYMKIRIPNMVYSGNNAGFLSTNDASRFSLLYKNTSTTLATYDAVNTASISGVFVDSTNDDVFQFGVRGNSTDGKMQSVAKVNLDAIKLSSEVSYDGSFAVGSNIIIGKDAQFLFEIIELKIYNKDKGIDYLQSLFT